MYYLEYANKKDAKELYDLQKLAFLSEAEMMGSSQIPALMESYEDFLSDFDSWTVLGVRSREGKLIGAVRYKKEGKKIEVGRLMVHPDWRNQGLASKMMKKVEQGADGDFFELFTCTKSYSNIRLYESLGYKQEEVVDKGEISLVYMRKEKEKKERIIFPGNPGNCIFEGSL